MFTTSEAIVLVVKRNKIVHIIKLKKTSQGNNRRAFALGRGRMEEQVEKEHVGRYTVEALGL